MPAASYWFTGAALAAFLALVATLSTLSYAWYTAAWNEQQNAAKTLAAQIEARKLADAREQLGRFLAEGAELLKLTRQEQNPPPTAAAEEWNARVVSYLNAHLGSAFVHRVGDASGLPMGTTMVQSKEHRNLESAVRVRTARLQQFLAELTPAHLK